jgi:protein gp37
MGKDSKIEWTDHTFNPWWGCVKVSPGCQNCYAETLCSRFPGEEGKIWGPAKTTTRRLFGDKHWNDPMRWQKAAAKAEKQAKVFVASMADVFEDHPKVWGARMRLWRVISETPNLIWLLLTKRPENIRRMLPVGWEDHLPDNVWLGTSTENQEWADKRIPFLLDIRAAVHFISYEPALGPIDIARYLDRWPTSEHPASQEELERKGAINWVIAGAESGPGAREMSEEWVRQVRDQCADASVSFLYKQKIVNGTKVSLPPLDGVKHFNFPEPR